MLVWITGLCAANCVPNNVRIREDLAWNEYNPSPSTHTCEQYDKDKTYHYEESGNGIHLATTCAPEMFCGGKMSGWIKGRHPKNNNNKETASVCVHRDGDCCKREYEVEIKNCGGKFYYKFKDDIDCVPKIRICTSRGPGKPSLINYINYIYICYISVPCIGDGGGGGGGDNISMFLLLIISFFKWSQLLHVIVIRAKMGEHALSVQDIITPVNARNLIQDRTAKPVRN